MVNDRQNGPKLKQVLTTGKLTPIIISRKIFNGVTEAGGDNVKATHR